MSDLLLRVVGQPRPQNTGQIITKPFPRVLPDKSTTEWKRLVRDELSRRMQADAVGRMDAAVAMGLLFRFARPKDHYGARGLKDRAPDRYMRTPDADRLATAVLDALKQVLFADDGQVSDLLIRKRYVADPDEPPSLTAHVMEVPAIERPLVVTARADELIPGLFVERIA